MHNSQHRIHKFFEQYRMYTLKDIDTIFGNSFLLRNINQNETYAAACLNKLADLDFFKKLIDKLFIPQNHTYSVEYFCNQKTPYKKEKIAYLINKIPKNKINQDYMEFLLFSSWFNKETHIFNLILNDFYENDLSLFTKGKAYQSIGKHFLLQDPKLVTLLIENKFPFEYNDLNFLPPKHINIEQIIYALKNVLNLDNIFNIDLSAHFGEEINLPEQLLKIRPSQIMSDFEISVSRPDVFTTLVPLLIKKGYPSSICEKFIGEKEFTHSLFDIINRREVYNIKSGSSQELRDTDKWRFFIKKYPDSEIFPGASLFSALIASLFSNQKSVFNYKKKFKKEISLIIEILNDNGVNCNIYGNNLHNLINKDEQDYNYNGSQKIHDLFIKTPVILRQALMNVNFMETIPHESFQNDLLSTYFFNEYKDKIVSPFLKDKFDEEDTMLLAESVALFFEKIPDITIKNLYLIDELIFNSIDKNQNIDHKEFYKKTLFNYMDIGNNGKQSHIVNEAINHNFDNFFIRFLQEHSDKEALSYFDQILLSYNLENIVDNTCFQKISQKRHEIYNSIKSNNKPRI